MKLKKLAVPKEMDAIPDIRAERQTMVMLLHFEGRNPIIETINGGGIHSDVFYHGSYAGKKEFCL